MGTGFVWGDGNVLELDNGDSGITFQISYKTLNILLNGEFYVMQIVMQKKMIQQALANARQEEKQMIYNLKWFLYSLPWKK